MEIISLNESQVNKSQLIFDLPDNFKNSAFDAVLILNKRESNIQDLLKLSGKLKWKGDAVKEQRRLRDEWD